jgi:hypothetical protein
MSYVQIHAAETPPENLKQKIYTAFNGLKPCHSFAKNFASLLLIAFA